jgi:hypothetical protein
MPAHHTFMSEKQIKSKSIVDNGTNKKFIKVLNYPNLAMLVCMKKNTNV